MALFFECMRSCANIALDRADIVRDGDFSTANWFERISHLKIHPPVAFLGVRAQSATGGVFVPLS